MFIFVKITDYIDEIKININYSIKLNCKYTRIYTICCHNTINIGV